MSFNFIDILKTMTVLSNIVLSFFFSFKLRYGMHLAMQNGKKRGGKNTKPMFLSVVDKHKFTAKQCVLTE